MRSADVKQEMLCSVRDLESIVPVDHPLRPVGQILNTALNDVGRVFEAMYAKSGLVVNHRLAQDSGTAEREAGLQMLAQPAQGRKTGGADKAYDSADFVEGCPTDRRRPARSPECDPACQGDRSAHHPHPGYEISQVVRKLIETILGDACEATRDAASVQSARLGTGGLGVFPGDDGGEPSPDAEADRRVGLNHARGGLLHADRHRASPPRGPKGKGQLRGRSIQVAVTRHMNYVMLTFERFSMNC